MFSLLLSFVPPPETSRQIKLVQTDSNMATVLHLFILLVQH